MLRPTREQLDREAEYVMLMSSYMTSLRHCSPFLGRSQFRLSYSSTPTPQHRCCVMAYCHSPDEPWFTLSQIPTPGARDYMRLAFLYHPNRQTDDPIVMEFEMHAQRRRWSHYQHLANHLALLSERWIESPFPPPDLLTTPPMPEGFPLRGAVKPEPFP